ncbi:MAG TPA: response regulator [Cryomorphaceae bacterium]|nr:response regulator [Cryomorphaceae bacterium]
METKGQKIRALIVDDELHARENLRFLIKDTSPEIEVVGTADGVSSAEELFHHLKPSLLFLDIRMPSGSEGFDLLEKLKEESFQVVFVTAFKDYAIRAFERRALHYVLKPIDERDLRETVERIMTSQTISEKVNSRENLKNLKEEIEDHKEPERLTIHHSKGIRIIEIADLDFLESSGNCTVLHFLNGDQYLDTRTLKVYESLLPDYFNRVHRSYMINLKEAQEILHGDDQMVVLKSGKSIPVSRERKKELIDAIKGLA